MMGRPPKSPLSPSTPLFRFMTEVTERVRPPLERVADDLARTLELERLQKELVAGCELGRPSVRCGFVTLYEGDRKSTRLNSSHQIISYAVFCLKKKKTKFT